VVQCVPVDPPTAGLSLHALPVPERGANVGRYVVAEVVGQGGMGVMLAAFDPQLDRRVAIKLLQWGGGGADRDALDRAQMLREGQALAKLSHKNVVAVHDVGLHQGRVFIAMEFVQGVTMAQWVARERPGWAAIVAQYLEAGRGLAAAHRAGLVHYDFKPNNVLIGDDGRVRVTDFGLARAQGRNTDVTSAAPDAAEPGALVTARDTGTPGYMAPEQRAGLTADPRSDQFSFCVALYEALFGERPPDAGRDGDVAPPPGTRAGRSVPSWVRGAVQRGLAADPNQRFATMDALLARLSRDPYSTLRRGALIVVPPVLVAAAVWANSNVRGEACTSTGLAAVWDADRKAKIEAKFADSGVPYQAATWATVEARVDAKAAAWTEARRSACLAEARGEPVESGRQTACMHQRFEELRWYSELLIGADAATVERAVSASDALGSVSDCQNTNASGTSGPPAAQRRVAEALAGARVMGQVGQYEAAAEAARQARGEAKAVDDRWLIAESTFELARVLQAAGQMQASRRTYHDAFSAGVAARYDEVVVRAAMSIAALAGEHEGDAAEAANWLEHAQGARARMGASGDVFDAPLSNANGRVLYLRGDYLAARDAFVHAIQASAVADTKAAENGRARAQGEASYHVNLGHAQASLGEYGAAAEQMRRALSLEEALYGDHPRVAATLSALCAIQRSAGRPVDAVPSCLRSAVIHDATVGRADAKTIAALIELGAAYLEADDVDAARATLTQAVAQSVAAWGEQHATTGLALNQLSAVHVHAGDLAQAESSTRRALAAMRGAAGQSHQDTTIVAANLASLLSLRGKYAEAEVVLRSNVAALEARLGPSDPQVALAVGMLGETYVARGQFEPALPYLQRTLAILQAAPGRPLDIAAAQFALGTAWMDAGRDPADAVALVQASATLLREADAPTERIRDVDAWLDRATPR